jgi:hypothetical protein
MEEGSTIDPNQFAASIQGKRWALLVGIANYPSSKEFEIQQLKAPVKDVNALAEFLKDSKVGGFAPDCVFTLTDEKATRRNILLTFNDIAKRAAPEDMVIFYFSGHGYRPSDSKTTYLIPYDLDMRDLDTTCINFDDLAKKIRDMDTSKVVVILDACHAGGVKPTGARAVANTGIVQRYLEAFQTSEGRALLLSSDESEVSWETEENGVFTRFLLEGLNGKADTNGDGIVSFTEVALYVEDTVSKFTRDNFPQVQRPTRRYEFGQVRGDIPLALNRTKYQEFLDKDLLDKRTGAILRAGIAGLEQTLKEFSLQVVQSAYRKALSGEQLTEQESMLLPELDLLKAGTITVDDYIVRARAIYNEFTLTQLRISVTPSDATVTLTPANTPNQVIPPSSPNVYQVAQGRYSLSAQRPGFAPHSRELTLGQKSESVTVTLERLMGTLQINVTPDDATVTITPLNVFAPDAEEIRAPKGFRLQLPTGEKKLPIGTYRVTAEKDGYEPDIKEPVEITTNTPARVTLTLTPKTPKSATIAASNLPEGTRVLVNGIPVTLPYEIPPGTHKIRLERDGFQPVEMSEILNPAQTLSLRPQWIPMMQLRIAVTPSDATVKLTPTNTPNQVIPPSSPNVYQVAQGRYSLSAQRPGYEPHSRELTLGQKSESVTVTLEKLMGTLQINVTPDDATVKITPLSVAAPDSEISTLKDFRVQPTTGKELPIGTYRVTAEKDGYESDIKEPVEITTNTPTIVTLTLTPKPATIAASDLPEGTRVLVNGVPVKLPYELPPGTHKIHLERDGFQPVEMSETLNPAQALSLRPQWIPIKPPTTGSPKGIPRIGAFAASMVVPGLGQHIQKHYIRGGIYELMTISVGVATLWAASYHQKTLDDYLDAKSRLRTEAPKLTELTLGIRALLSDQKDAYNKAKFARTLAIGTQIALGVAWGINALDAYAVKPAQQRSGITLEARPTSDGGRILVSMKF